MLIFAYDFEQLQLKFMVFVILIVIVSIFGFVTHMEFKICEPRHAKTNVLHMRKKNAGQLRGNSEADQRLCFRYIDSTTPLLSKSKISSL